MGQSGAIKIETYWNVNLSTVETWKLVLSLK